MGAFIEGRPGVREVLEGRPRTLASGFGILSRIADDLDLRWRDVLWHAEQLAHLVPPSGEQLRPETEIDRGEQRRADRQSHLDGR